MDRNCKFSQNTAGLYPGIYLLYSIANITDSVFEDQETDEAAFIRGIYSNAIITN